MALAPRLLRRIIIAVVFLAVFFLFGYGTRQLTQPTPTCTDGAKNGEEEGIDCGLFACQNYCEPDLDPPKVVSTELIEAGDNDYDFVAEIVNPHKDFGASEVTYELTLSNGGGTTLTKREGIFYILPSQTKYLIITFITTEKNILRTEFKIKSAKWQKIESLEGMNLIVRNQQYKTSSDGRLNTLDATIFNDSDFEFESVDVGVVLRNSKKDIIAVNKSEIRTFLARSERHFRVTWPFSIGGEVVSIEIKPVTNLFENSNFIKRYGSEVEKFQKY
ncbi:MAG: hypothetical protein A3B91_05280 [Candidatus Yanofskybacteria bacterium RIFCSPHIGHO2_02_FULL_41_29]|uniref:Uncharacterized protein n=1 Tax=Candidatus Yanofskybacteria bacterium RIFCSPHIGHO2_01_FULL_41_53 TaxID=1802663 RepID=A0A1F8EK06_9BACT|nr:MAG: hypothetical protein A2650_05165 [Candidatus Yanofskybacteria bacterium RIFCSPHIGHO2_01_FULL_41_53]OGN12234.1 MAG: hypothetical protein A3B91_05280 [Candidatus Yanofskybacteria bacterium RIFCSPHIGHO2_02_FULL_41_29]OGN23750.1 MAG: hypothetical protein A2916_02850 [Candidatus Yanofskybacteria bacterium RIFCSPLOWO2_01_FULL_41_67]OGN30351.1 MAG: hypothetical protein A3H54_05080 [Candidatus Yanofskybacteria bacterium RIFCSPLOWO2_02_FULL_41_13]OGN35457.1 MAG: hypothetical protein A3F98_01185 